MRGIVRARCKPDQILVIVGGNSIFHGVGQPVGKIWTEELQRLLGPRYCVINFALRGALCTDGGAYVAESLRHEFPRQIYVANTSPFAVPEPYGIEPYRYLFWQTRARGLLEDFAPREARLKGFMAHDLSLGDRFDLTGRYWLDRAFRYNDLWNWVGYRYFFTIQNPHTPDRPQATWARKKFKDEEGDFELMPLHERFKAEGREAEMKIVRGFSATHVERDPDGHWAVRIGSREQFAAAAKAAFPDDLKARTLIMLSRNSPLYLGQLTPDERQREEFVYREGIAAWRALGYRSNDYGADFAPEDFGDRTHLTAAGGRKLAKIVAAEIMTMTRQLGYENGRAGAQ
ncbi:MAG: hypothetical protein HZA32_18585 [Opitutae bacterium]|nr:hypothetical protein [Opitutae bacterium]